MLSSMTGFSSVTGEAGGFQFRLEARSLNHRFLEIKSRLPGMLFGLDPEIEMLARAYFERGKIEILVSIEKEPEDLSLPWSRPRAKALLKTFEEMKDELGLAGELDLGLLISLKDDIISEPERRGKQIWRELEPVFQAGFEQLRKARQEEGNRLEQDLRGRIKRMVELQALIRGREEQALLEARSRLQKRMEKLLAESSALDPGRLEQELAILVTRLDISEEVERISSHLKQFELELDQAGARGRKLDFLTQELNREFNTMGSKTQNLELSHWSVEAKTELERIRQQIQNIE